MEDEWHVLLICPLYESIRRGMPFSADELCVEGHPHQGAGCTNRNLQSLVGAILRTERFQFIIDYLIRAFKIRRQHRKPPTPNRAPLRVTQGLCQILEKCCLTSSSRVGGVAQWTPTRNFFRTSIQVFWRSLDLFLDDCLRSAYCPLLYQESSGVFAARR